MSRDKQIEEMAKDFDTVIQRRCFHKSCNECEFNRYDTCKALEATTLINDYGYRKASEVAREIIKEIEKEINDALKSNYNVLPQLEEFAELWSRVQGKIDALRGIGGFVEELKEKYTEDEG